MIKLKDSNPANEIVALLKANNPLLGGVNGDALIIKSCKPAVTGTKSTTMEIIGNGNAGLVGTIAFNYDRLDLTRVFNQFGVVTKKPTVRVFGNPGTTTTVYNMISQINAALGTAFTVVGNYPDLADATFTFPAKAGFVDIVISGKYSADGIPPTSIRIKPGTTLTLTVANTGYKLADVLTTRSVRPLIRTDRNLNWSLPEANSVDGLKMHPALAARFIDFSDIFAKSAAEIITYVSYSGGGNNYTYSYDLTVATYDAINARLTASGLSTLTSRRVYIAGDKYTPTIEQAKTRLGTDTSTLATVAAVNRSLYNRVMKIPAANIVVKAGVVNADYYLHYNV